MNKQMIKAMNNLRDMGWIGFCALLAVALVESCRCERR